MGMKTLMAVVLGLALSLSPAGAAPDDAQAFHAEIVKLYDFDSANAGEAELDVRLKAIEAFAARMDADKSRYLPLLRTELASAPYVPVFATQGPSWLAGLSQDPADLQRAADSLARWRIDQVSPAGYVTVLHGLAANGADVTAAALRIADKPDFYATLGVHVMPVGQFDAMVLLLFSMPEERYVGAIAERLRTEKDPRIQKTLAQLLHTAATADGLSALKGFAARTDIDEALRKECRKMIAHKGHAHGKAETVSELREKRMAAVRKPVGHDHDRGVAFNELSEALIHQLKRS